MSSEESNVTETEAVFQHGSGKKGDFFIFLAGATELHLKCERSEEGLDEVVARLTPGDRVKVGYIPVGNERGAEVDKLEGVFHSVQGGTVIDLMLMKVGAHPDHGMPPDQALGDGAHFWYERDNLVLFFPFQEYPWLKKELAQANPGELWVAHLINATAGEPLIRAKLLRIFDADLDPED